MILIQNVRISLVLTEFTVRFWAASTSYLFLFVGSKSRNTNGFLRKSLPERKRWTTVGQRKPIVHKSQHDETNSHTHPPWSERVVTAVVWWIEEKPPILLIDSPTLSPQWSLPTPPPPPPPRDQTLIKPSAVETQSPPRLSSPQNSLSHQTPATRPPSSPHPPSTAVAAPPPHPQHPRCNRFHPSISNSSQSSPFPTPPSRTSSPPPLILPSNPPLPPRPLLVGGPDMRSPSATGLWSRPPGPTSNQCLPRPTPPTAANSFTASGPESPACSGFSLGHWPEPSIGFSARFGSGAPDINNETVMVVVNAIVCAN